MEAVQLVIKHRKAAVLTPSQLPCLSHVPTVNMTSGCAHACLYCYARSYSQYPGERQVILYANILDKLREEVPRKRVRPRFVYFSPSTDVFQPAKEVLDLAYEVFAFLLSQDIGIAFATKGTIPEKHMALFAAHAGKIRAQIGLITLDQKVISAFEPGCASIETRLEQIKKLVNSGIDTEVRLDPILPSLTDDDETLSGLFAALKELRVDKVALNVLYLRPAMVSAIRKGMAGKDLGERVLARYRSGITINVCDGRFSQWALPKGEREEIFMHAMRLAKNFGLGCHCCGCMNPDIFQETCNLTGEWPVEDVETRQMPLL